MSAKQAILFVVLLGFISSAHGQGTFSNTGSGLNDLGRYMDDDSTWQDSGEDDASREATEKADGSLEDVTMETTDSSANFDNLPSKGSVTLHITDAEGAVLLERRINLQKSSVAISRLPNGLFFATLTYKDHRKAFPLDRSQVEKNKRKPAHKNKEEEDDN
jgi:hypothetical protein